MECIHTHQRNNAWRLVSVAAVSLCHSPVAQFVDRLTRQTAPSPGDIHTSGTDSLNDSLKSKINFSRAMKLFQFGREKVDNGSMASQFLGFQLRVNSFEEHTLPLIPMNSSMKHHKFNQIRHS